MRIATVLVSAALAACAGDDGAPTTDDGGDGDGASGPVDGGPDAPPEGFSKKPSPQHSLGPPSHNVRIAGASPSV
jgi:hypothetical protein